MIANLRHNFLRSVRRAIGKVLRAALIGIVLGALAGEAAGVALDGGWPPHLFVHVVAIAFAVVLGYALAVTTALVEGVRGMVAAAEAVDDATKSEINRVESVLDPAANRRRDAR